MSDNYETGRFQVFDMLDIIAVDGDVLWDPFPEPERRDVEEAFADYGFNYVKTTGDFFAQEIPPGPTLIVTNPPFSRKKEALERLVTIGIPFILILPAHCIHRRYFLDLVSRTSGTWHVLLASGIMSFFVAGVRQPAPNFASAFYVYLPPGQEREIRSVSPGNLHLRLAYSAQW